MSKDHFELHGFTFDVFHAFLSEESASYLKARKNQFQNREQQSADLYKEVVWVMGFYS